MWQYNQIEMLYHHGVKGQKWGVRKYVKPNGTLTNSGRLAALMLKSKNVKQEIRLSGNPKKHEITFGNKIRRNQNIVKAISASAFIAATIAALPFYGPASPLLGLAAEGGTRAIGSIPLKLANAKATSDFIKANSDKKIDKLMALN